MEVDVLAQTPNAERLVCQTARGDYHDGYVGDTAFEKLMEPVEGETIDDKMETLITHLFKRGHWGPLEHPNITIAVEGVSRPCMAQITRHRLASFDVQSMRYVDFGDKEAIVPASLKDTEHVARETGVVDLDEDELRELRNQYNRLTGMAITQYQNLVEAGVPKEDARFVLPIGMPVNLSFTMNGRAILHLLDMRWKADAQWEVRELAERVFEHYREWMPITAELYEEKRPFALTP